MEIEARQGVVAKKLWKMVRVSLFMITKGIAKTKTMIHGKLAGKGFINTLMMNHQLYYSSFTCRDNDNSFISPCEYEFSCSNTPVNPLYQSSRRLSKPRQRYKDVFIMNTIAVRNSCLDTLPVARELRVTDSPFALKDEGDSYQVDMAADEGDSYQVDMAAEEFINNFYKQLNRQNRSIATH
ncbi:unnamed protein product [Lathyrus sativus]|nr:unnamed protein product [Lathyrus sativus]